MARPFWPGVLVELWVVGPVEAIGLCLGGGLLFSSSRYQRSQVMEYADFPVRGRWNRLAWVCEVATRRLRGRPGCGLGN